MRSGRIAKVTPMKRLLTAGLAAVSLALAAAATASPTIELTDGSRIQGDIQGIDNGVYTIVSPSLGTVHLAQSKIARIVYGGGDANPAGASNASSARDDAMAREMQQIQSRLAQDPSAVKSIMSLQSDPEIMAVLNDPMIAKAIQEGDYTSLLANPKIQALENNSHLKELVQQQAH